MKPRGHGEATKYPEPLFSQELNPALNHEILRRALSKKDSVVSGGYLFDVKLSVRTGADPWFQKQVLKR